MSATRQAALLSRQIPPDCLVTDLLKAHSEHRFPVSSSRLPELVTLLKAHSGHRFPVLSSRLCLNWLRYWRHTLSIAFRYHPPDSAWIGYATEGTLFNSCCCLPTGRSALRKVWVLVRPWKQQIASKHARTKGYVVMSQPGGRHSYITQVPIG